MRDNQTNLTKNGEITMWLDTIIHLSLDDTGISQQMAFISWQLLHPRYEDIFKMLQKFADAEIQW